MANASININNIRKGDLVSFDVIKNKKKSYWVIPFRPVGKTSWDKNSMNSLNIISKFSKAELFLLDVIQERIDVKAEVVIKKSDFSLHKQRVITSAIKSWTTKNLIKRTKREHYLVNPYFLVPDRDFQTSAKENWEAVKEK